MAKTLVIGASPNPSRYAYLATSMLKDYRHEVVPFGIEVGEIEGTQIVQEFPKDEEFDTVTLYINPKRQPALYDSIIALKPKRVIFNPGTENDEFEALLEKNNIKPVEGCTLVMLRSGQY